LVFRPLLPHIDNCIANAQSEQSDHWHTYMGVLKYMLSDIETLSAQMVSQDIDTQRPPHLFSMSPICSFQLRHITLDNTAVTNLCKLHRDINRLSSVGFPDRTFIEVFDRRLVENQSGTRLISGTLTTNGVQVSFHNMKRIRVRVAKHPPTE